MATLKQKALAKAIVENLESGRPLTGQRLAESVGYSPATAEDHLGRTIEQKGVQEELANWGFTEENAKRVVASILLDPEKNASDRLKASEMVFKVHGSFAPDKSISVNLNKTIDPVDSQKQDALVEDFEERFKQSLLDEPTA